MPSGSYTINDHLVIVGAKSIRLVASAGAFSVLNTTSMGNLSAYTGAASGAPVSGTVGLWLYLQAGDISSVTLRLGSSAGNYVEIAGVRTYTDGTDQQDGWNYYVFRLKNGTVTGTPNWTSVAYTRFAFASSGTPTCILDYLAIGTGDKIGNNGLGDRRTNYMATTYNY